MRRRGCAACWIRFIRWGERHAQSGSIAIVLGEKICSFEPLFGADQQLHDVPCCWQRQSGRLKPRGHRRGFWPADGQHDATVLLPLCTVACIWLQFCLRFWSHVCCSCRCSSSQLKQHSGSTFNVQQPIDVPNNFHTSIQHCNYINRPVRHMYFMSTRFGTQHNRPNLHVPKPVPYSAVYICPSINYR